MATQAQVRAAIEIAKTLAETIKDLGGVPSGELYAHVMGTMSLDTYNSIIGLLERSGLVKNQGHYLTYVGPR